MKRLLLWIVALVIAAAPVLNDVCRLDCERAHAAGVPAASARRRTGARTITPSAPRR